MIHQERLSNTKSRRPQISDHRLIKIYIIYIDIYIYVAKVLFLVLLGMTWYFLIRLGVSQAVVNTPMCGF